MKWNPRTAGAGEGSMYTVSVACIREENNLHKREFMKLFTCTYCQQKKSYHLLPKIPYGRHERSEFSKEHGEMGRGKPTRYQVTTQDSNVQASNENC